MSFEFALYALLFLVTVVAIGSIYYAIKFGIVIIRIQDAIEESLDVIDDRYASVSKVLETPLFYDSPEIRKVYKDIADVRSSILYIANVMVDSTSYRLQEEKDFGKEEEEEDNSSQSG